MSGSSWKTLLRPAMPVGLLEMRQRRRARQVDQTEETRRRKFQNSRSAVTAAAKMIRELSNEQCHDVAFLEKQFIPALGLNDEALHEQPPELSAYFGVGLHIWQYPSQLSKYLAWVAANAAGTRCYMEIGCRWGGMVILISEWLRRNGAPLEAIIAVDPIDPTPFVEQYFSDLADEKTKGTKPISTRYIQAFSTAPAVKDIIAQERPDFVFVDGDHTLQGALKDHLLVRDVANVIVHHDINSVSCPDTTLLWQALQAMERDHFDFESFVDRYPSVGQPFLGIGVMKRKRTN